MVPGFNITGLLPDSLHLYYRYNGSLTTPPCFQSVMWTVFNQTVMLSHDQVCRGSACAGPRGCRAPGLFGSPAQRAPRPIHPALSSQISVLVTSLQYDHGKPLQNNFRPTQALHKRWVLASFEPTLSRERQVPTGKERASTLGVHWAAGAQGKKWGEASLRGMHFSNGLPWVLEQGWGVLGWVLTTLLEDKQRTVPSVCPRSPFCHRWFPATSRSSC